jgi:hypothetical protein
VPVVAGGEVEGEIDTEVVLPAPPSP